ncbi:MAG: hypothetical protein ACR2F6_10780 [Mycobacteriales bacterium]
MSDPVAAVVDRVIEAWPDRDDLLATFEAALRSSLETTVRPATDGSIFVVGGHPGHVAA